MILTRKFIYQNSKDEEMFFSLDSVFILNNITGIDSNTTDISSSESVGQVGSTINHKHVKEKNITINGTIKKDTKANRNKLLDIVLPADDAKLFCIVDERKYYLEVTPTATPIIENLDYGPKFQFALNCFYPFWKETDINSTTLNGIQSRFRFPINFGGTWQVGTSIEAEFINIRNKGNQKIGIEITLKAESLCSGFKIQNVKTLEFLYLDYEMQAGEEITITTGYNNKRITSNLNGNIIRYLDLINSAFLQLEPGDNIFKFSAEINEQGVQVNADYSIVKVGL